jgi:hypothetical protein
VSSNPVHDEVYSIQHYVIKFVSDLRQVGGFLWVLRFPPPTRLTATIYNRNIVESGVKHHKPNQTIYVIKSWISYGDEHGKNVINVQMWYDYTISVPSWIFQWPRRTQSSWYRRRKLLIKLNIVLLPYLVYYMYSKKKLVFITKISMNSFFKIMVL